VKSTGLEIDSFVAHDKEITKLKFEPSIIQVVDSMRFVCPNAAGVEYRLPKETKK
jgi:hypothetical protein